MKSRIFQLGIITSLIFAVLFSSCKKDNGNGNDHNNPTTVSIVNFSFSPSKLTVMKGNTVTWTNNDTAPHTVTADDNSFTSGKLNKGDTYSHTFNDAGTINYHCSIHPMMTASVVVQ